MRHIFRRFNESSPKQIRKAVKSLSLPNAKERQRRILEAALRGQHGRFWYDEAQREIRSVARAWGVHPVIVAVAVAATSPATPVIASPRMSRGGGSASNIGKARRVVKAIARGEKIPIKATAPGATRLFAFEQCRQQGHDPQSCLVHAFPSPDTTKTHAFVRNLLGDREAVTVDTLVGRGAGIPLNKAGSVSVTKARYKLIAADIRAVAKKLGWAPAEVMAAAWTGWEGSGGLRLATTAERKRTGRKRSNPRRLTRRTNGTRAALVQHMIKCGWSPQDAERMAPKSEAQQSSRRALSPQELAAFEREARKVQDPALRTILLLLPVTGMRVSEAVTMKLSATQPHGRKGHLQAMVLGKAKGGRSMIGKNGRGPNGERVVYDEKAKVINGRNIGRVVDRHGKPVKAPKQPRTVPLGRHGTALVAEFMRVRPRSKLDLVFVGPKGGKITTAMVQQACKAVVKKAGLPSEITPHWLRHSYVSRAIAKCWDPQRVREIIGHGKKDPVTGKSIGRGRLPAVTLLYIDDHALK